MNACLYYTYAILSHSLSLSLYILNNISNAFYSTALTSIVPCLRVATVMFLREKTSQEFWSSNCQTFISAGNHHLLGRFFFSPTCSFPKKSPLLFFWKFWREKNIHPPLGVFFFFSGENPKIPSSFCVCVFFPGRKKKTEAAAHVAHKAGSNRGMTNAEAEFAAATAGAIAAVPWRRNSVKQCCWGDFLGLLKFPLGKINSYYQTKTTQNCFFKLRVFSALGFLKECNFFWENLLGFIFFRMLRVQ